MSRFLTVGVLLLALTSILTAQVVNEKPEIPINMTADAQLLADLSQLAHQTIKSVDDGQMGLAWTTRIESSDTQYDVSYISQGGMTRCAIKLVAPVQTPVNILEYIERDGLWYVFERGMALGKYRPFEVPWNMPNAYVLLMLGELHAPMVSANATIHAQLDETVEFRTPLPPALRQQFMNRAQFLRIALARLAPHSQDARTTRANLEWLDHLLRTGQSFKVDHKTGLVLTGATSQYRYAVTQLELNPKIDPEMFAVVGHNWRSLAGDPCVGVRPDELALFSYVPSATEETAEHLSTSMEQVLVNLSNGQVRRLPFPGATFGSSSLSPDRTRAWFTGADYDGARLAIYEADLRTGLCTMQDPERIIKADMHAPVMSPDGRLLVFVTARVDFRVQVVVMDYHTNVVRALGTPIKLIELGLSWLDDSSGLILSYKKLNDDGQPIGNWIARMGLDGTIHDLVTGDRSIVVPNRQRIIYRSMGLWHTCDLQGQNPQLYRGGMQDYLYPAPAPDGNRILWMCTSGRGLPQPVVQDYEQGTIQELHLGPGLWATPAWR